MRTLLWAWVLAAGLLAACSEQTSPDAGTDTGADASPPDVDWPLYGHDPGEMRYSALDEINQDNVGELGLAWSYELGSTRGVEATPIVVDGVMYVSAPWSIVHAIDAKSGAPVWTFDPEVNRQWGRWACCDVINRGVAVDGGRLFVGALDGRLIAVDRRTGDEIWSVQTTPTDKPYTITGAPRVAGGKVIIGNGGAEYGVRGYVSAYDVATGEMAWRFYTVPGNPEEPLEHPDLEIAMPTWSGGQWWEIGGGGTVWDSMAHDPDLGLIYVGVGNGSPWSRYIRSPGGGDNLFLASILAIDVETGRLKWHYQTVPGDNWDYTATQHIMLADLEMDGEVRKVLLQAPKNGFLYVIDRADGELLSATPYVAMNWASHVDIETGRPVEIVDGNYANEMKKVYPGPTGAHSWQPMSFSRRTNLLYVPAHDTGYWFSNDDDFEYNPAGGNLGMDFVATEEIWNADPPEYRGHLIAWDPIAKRPSWQKRFDGYFNGGLLSTAGGLLFQGKPDGSITAYRDSDGEVLWQTESTTGLFAPPVTYRIDGEQYVAIAAGMGGYEAVEYNPSRIINEYHNEGRVLVFKLGGTAPMPVSLKREQVLPDLPEQTASVDVIAEGKEHYRTYCGACHGPYAVSGLLVPDLRYLSPDKRTIFEYIVVDGAFRELGMPSFGDVLTKEDARAIHAYLLQRSYELKEELM